MKILVFVMGMWEWLLILAIVVIFFGAKKIPGLARGFGKGIREFKEAVKEEKPEEEEEEGEGEGEDEEKDVAHIKDKNPED